jgi:purine nucleosidase
MSRELLIIDTDPGVDDAWAILMALSNPAFEVKALTVVGGNVGLACTTLNALRLVELAGTETPVYAGSSAPLLHPAADAAFVHGEDGFGDAGLGVPTRSLQTEHAALALIRYARMNPRQITLVALGPLTNIALALKLEPRLPHLFKGLVIMGGAVSGRGNTSVLSAEFNIGFDPEAAHLVTSAWPQYTLVDWEATLAHAPSVSEVESWLRGSSTRCRFMHQISRRTLEFVQRMEAGQWAWADPLAMFVALNPDQIRRQVRRGLKIALEGAHTRGATLVDMGQRLDWPQQADIVLEVDHQAFHASMRAALA